jgi:hypothetical protein
MGRGPMTKSATEFTFQAPLLATISVEAATQAEAERNCARCWDIGRQPWVSRQLVVPIAIEGDL